MSACPDREMALHAMIDGELDSLDAFALETHLRGCADCRAALNQLEAMRTMFSDRELHYRAPLALHDKVAAMLPAKRPTFRPFGRSAMPWLGGGITGAIAAGLAMLLLTPQPANMVLADELVTNHIRSLQVAHLTDVVTSNRHVVKPWFNGRIDFSPPVVDLVAQGFPLVGGRLDVIERHSVAVLVYRRRLHMINVFIRPASQPSVPGDGNLHRDSYNLVNWTSGGLEFWAVSDIDPGELVQFRSAFIAIASQA